MDEEYSIDDTSEETEIKDIDPTKDTGNSSLDLSETQYSPTDASGGSYGSSQTFAPRDTIQIPNHIIEKGAKAAYIALQDVWNPTKGTGTIEITNNAGNVGYKGHSVNEMLTKAGSAPGNPWCASATYTWWTEAGISSLPKESNPAGVPNWVSWAAGKGRWSKTPVVGALAVYGRDYHHIGIVVQVNKDGTICTVEGNYSQKVSYVTLNANQMLGISGFVIPG
jgi:hypothetical protein